jgi:Ran GTPase-activating protein (RanGAP) involved in mRNA processing and transport
MIVLTVAAQDGAKAAPKEEAKPTITYSDEPDEDEEEAVEAPKKRPAKKAEEVPEKKDLANVLAAWGDGDDEDEE